MNVPSLSALDTPTLNRTASPGSLRYFALLYTPLELRDAVAALFVIDTELRESARSANHDVAHTRLTWWRSEVDRLVNNNPQHPATRLLQGQQGSHRSAFTKLHELVAAADMDLARMTYVNLQELRAYCSRSGGALLECIAAQLAGSSPLDEPVRAAINRLGIGIRQAEIVRDLRQDAHEGRVYLPLDDMERLSISHQELDRPKVLTKVREVLHSLHQSAKQDLQKPLIENSELNAALRPIWVLAALHRRLLERIANRNYEVADERLDLGPIEKSWVAWKAARQTK
jgi:15-cis-phytoene synthase